MTTLYLFHDGRRGDVLLCRPLVRAIAAHGTSVVVGCCRDDVDLWQGLPGDVRVVASPFANTHAGAVHSLAVLQPAGTVAIELWLGGGDAEPTRQWADLVAYFQGACARRGLAVSLGDTGTVPMLDFAVGAAPRLERPAVWLDTARGIDARGWFAWDLERLARALPDLDLWCTTPLASAAANLRDASRWTWAQQSLASEQCAVVVGSTWDPFVRTLTEANRWKPKALVGHDPRAEAPWWDYPGNPLELLPTMDELVDFLVANAPAVWA